MSCLYFRGMEGSWVGSVLALSGKVFYASSIVESKDFGLPFSSSLAVTQDPSACGQGRQGRQQPLDPPCPCVL